MSCRATIVTFAFCVVSFVAAAWPGRAVALKTRPHPIQDLIEGDQRTPPEGEHIVEERAATPAYPLPDMAEFPQQTAIETFPLAQEADKSKEAASEFEDEWAEWSSWDEWSDLDEWDSWEEGGANETSDVHSKQPPAARLITQDRAPGSKTSKQADQNSEGFEWDSWLSKGEET